MALKSVKTKIKTKGPTASPPGSSMQTRNAYGGPLLDLVMEMMRGDQNQPGRGNGRAFFAPGSANEEFRRLRELQVVLTQRRLQQRNAGLSAQLEGADPMAAEAIKRQLDAPMATFLPAAHGYPAAWHVIDPKTGAEQFYKPEHFTSYLSKTMGVTPQEAVKLNQDFTTRSLREDMGVATEALRRSAERGGSPFQHLMEIDASPSPARARPQTAGAPPSPSPAGAPSGPPAPASAMSASPAVASAARQLGQAATPSVPSGRAAAEMYAKQLAAQYGPQRPQTLEMPTLTTPQGGGLSRMPQGLSPQQLAQQNAPLPFIKQRGIDIGPFTKRRGVVDGPAPPTEGPMQPSPLGPSRLTATEALPSFDSLNLPPVQQPRVRSLEELRAALAARRGVQGGASWSPPPGVVYPPIPERPIEGEVALPERFPDQQQTRRRMP